MPLLKALIVMAGIAGTLGTASQTPHPGRSERPLARLAFLEGRWQGDCKLYRSAADVVPFFIVETASTALDGALLQIEGVATVVIEGTERIVGKGIGFVHYDEKRGEFQLRHYESNGATFDAPMTVAGRDVSYESQDSDGQRLRVRIRVTDDGRWEEQVDRFEAGGGWRLFREYHLRRVK